MPAAISVRALHHRYGDRVALADVSFEVEAGEIFGLLGPNGGGKTTLFRILTTLVPPTSGTAIIDGHDVTRAPAEVRRRIGVVFQSPALDPQLTVTENLRHHGHLYGLAGAALRERIDEVLATLQVRDRAGDRVATLSGGLQRRVEVAKALLPRPRVLVLDEPSTGLDPAARREIRDHLASLAAAGTTVLMTTHLMDEGAQCHRVAILDRGRLVALGTPQELTATVGGDVLWISAPDPAAVADQLRTRFGVDAEVVDGRVRLERPEAHAFVPALIEAFPGSIEAVTLSRPTLEDVFVHHTGRRFD